MLVLYDKIYDADQRDAQGLTGDRVDKRDLHRRLHRQRPGLVGRHVLDGTHCPVRIDGGCLFTSVRCSAASEPLRLRKASRRAARSLRACCSLVADSRGIIRGLRSGIPQQK